MIVHNSTPAFVHGDLRAVITNDTFFYTGNFN